jgi:hypothetical protein
MKTVKTPYKYGSPSHIALKYASLKRRSVATIDGLITMFPHKFEKPSRAERSFQMLERYGFVMKFEDGWKITASGISVLKTTTPEYRGEGGFSRK